MRNVLFFALMLSFIVLISAHAKKNRQGKDEKNYVENVMGIKLEMIYVNGGTFIMGNTSEKGGCSDERPITEIYLDSYYIGAFEVTQKQWNIIMRGENIADENDNLPITYVSWNEATLFCDKLSQLTGKNYKLPTEEQWEYAALAGENDNKMYSGGSNIKKVAWYFQNSEGTVHQVGLKAPNKLGIYDMSGNVYEWCIDNYNSYIRKYDFSKENNVGSYKVLRGGCWSDYASNCRATYRCFEIESCANGKIGFRVVLIP